MCILNIQNFRIRVCTREKSFLCLFHAHITCILKEEKNMSEKKQWKRTNGKFLRFFSEVKKKGKADSSSCRIVYSIKSQFSPLLVIVFFFFFFMIFITFTKAYENFAFFFFLFKAVCCHTSEQVEIFFFVNFIHLSFYNFCERNFFFFLLRIIFFIFRFLEYSDACCKLLHNERAKWALSLTVEIRTDHDYSSNFLKMFYFLLIMSYHGHKKNQFSHLCMLFTSRLPFEIRMITNLFFSFKVKLIFKVQSYNLILRN